MSEQQLPTEWEDYNEGTTHKTAEEEDQHRYIFMSRSVTYLISRLVFADSFKDKLRADIASRGLTNMTDKELNEIIQPAQIHVEQMLEYMD